MGVKCRVSIIVAAQTGLASCPGPIFLLVRLKIGPGHEAKTGPGRIHKCVPDTTLLLMLRNKSSAPS